jgi:hypothetical protein
MQSIEATIRAYCAKPFCVTAVSMKRQDSFKGKANNLATLGQKK